MTSAEEAAAMASTRAAFRLEHREGRVCRATEEVGEETGRVMTGWVWRPGRGDCLGPVFGIDHRDDIVKGCDREGTPPDFTEKCRRVFLERLRWQRFRCGEVAGGQPFAEGAEDGLAAREAGFLQG